MSEHGHSAGDLVDRLERALRWSDEFTLVFVKCNHAPQREALRGALAERLEDLHLCTIHLQAPILSLRVEIENRCAAEKAPDAIQVLGLELSINKEGEAAPVLGRLNHDRDLIRRTVHGALVIWLPDFALDCLARGAPDFWAWRSGVFEAETDSKLWQAEISQLRATTDDAATTSLPLEAKRREIARIAELLRSARALPEQDKRTRSTIGDLLNRFGILHASLGDVRKAIECYEKSLEIARDIGDRQGEGNALGNLGIAHAALGGARTAIGYFEQALAICRETGDRRGEGASLGNLGLAHAALGDATTAIAYYEQCLEIYRGIDDLHGEATSLGNLGTANWILGQVRKAVGYHDRALSISREIGDRHGEGQDLGNLGIAHAALGDARTAIGYHEQGLEIAREIGDRRGEGNALGNLGIAHFSLGDVRTAIGYYEQQLEIAREIGDRRGEANTLWNSALAHDSIGERAAALRLAKAALAIREAIEDPNADKVRRKISEWTQPSADTP